MAGCRLENDSRKRELLLTVTVLVAIAVACVSMSAQNPPQSVGWKGANNVIAEQMWGNGTSRNYTGTQQDVNDAANAGIRWSRFVAYTAPDNACTDQEMQHLVAMQRASGINIMLDIQRLASSGRNCSGATVTQTLYDPVNNSSDAQYTSWLANMVNQYKPYIHYYELGNEENGTGDWKLVDEPTPTRDASVGGCTTTANYRNGVASYVQFLKDTYNTIKANDPTAKVIIGGLSEWVEECFIDELATNQAWLYMDYMALHPYGVCPTNADCSGYPNSLERVQSYQTHLAAWPSPYNSIGTWITEIGYYNKKDDPTWTLPPQAPDPATEATWLVHEMTMLHNNGITAPIFWYDLHEESNCDVGFGLTMRNNGGGKCATDTYNLVYSSFRGITDSASDLVISVTPFWPLPMVNAGTTATYNVSVADVSGFSGGSVTLGITGLPSGASANFSPNPVNPGSASTVSVSTGTSTPVGTYALTITATDSNTAAGSALNSQVTLVVNAAATPDFTISATPSSRTVPVGSSTTYTASASPLNGFTGTVSLSVTGLPSGATGTFNPTLISGGSGSSTLTVTTVSTTPTGSYTLTITGTSGSLTHSATVTLVVGAASSITFKQLNSNDNTGLPPATASSVAVPYTGAQTAGGLNVVVVGWNDTTATVKSVTDTKGNAYVLAVGPTLVSGTLSQSIYYAKNIVAAAANGNTVTVMFNGSASYPDVRIAEYSGLSTSSPLDKVAAAIGNSTNSDSGAATTSFAKELLFGANTMTQTASGPGPGYTQRIITGDGDLVEDQIVSATGTYHATGPLSPAGAWVMQLVTFHQ